MKYIIFLLPIFILFSSFSTSGSNDLIRTESKNVSYHFPKNDILIPEKFASMKVREIEKIAGRKFSLKEKIAIKILQYKTKKELKKGDESSSKGKIAMILSIIGLALIFVPYGILASVPLAILAILLGSKAVKENPQDKQAKAGRIMGFLTLGLFVVALFISLIFLAAFSGIWG